jgi:hypothetical protein
MIDAVLQLGLVGVVVFMLWRRIVAEVPQSWIRLADVAEIGALTLVTAYVGHQALGNITDPHAWDFPVFYVVGRNAWEGISFYNPAVLLESFAQLEAAAGVPNEWVGEIGFWYAPPTAIVLAPFGATGFTTSLIAQYIVQGVLLAASVAILHRVFPLRKGAMGLVEMAMLFMLFRPTIEAFRIAQIVFGAVLFTAIALVTVRRSPWIAGLSLGFGSLFKHLLIIPAVLTLALRRWRVLAGTILAVVGAGVLAGLLFGFDTYREFVTFGPSDRPPELALDPVIESLNAVLRRAFDAVPATSGAMESILYLPYLALGALFTGVTVIVAWVANRRGRVELGFGLILVLSLVVYPNTLYNTLPLLVPVTVMLVVRARSLPFDPRVTLAVIGIQYAVVATQVVPAFYALVLTWVYLVVCLSFDGGEGNFPGGRMDSEVGSVPESPDVESEHA